MTDLKGLRILLVDDQKFIRSMVAQGLKGAGAEVIEAADGLGALNVLGLGANAGNSFGRLKEMRPDLFEEGAVSQRMIHCVVTDIRMAPMNGLEMLKAVRVGYSKASRDLPVIIMSAHTDEPLIGAAVALDAHGFVSKPVSQKTITDRVQRAMRVKFKPKETAVYQTLIIPELDETIFQSDVAELTNDMLSRIRAGDVHALAGERMETINWNALRTGDIVAAEFKTIAGQLVVPAGTHVNEVLITALSDLSHVTALPTEIQIRRKGI